ncbi:Putative ribonuclease H protein At1g65750 [Linum grandiflorum]
MRVMDLINPGSREWKSELIGQIFCSRDAHEIMAIPVHVASGSDRRIWHYSKDGQYTVKTAYRLYTEHIVDRSNLHNIGEWSSLWQLAVPPKVKQFGWRLGHDIIPTRDRLRRRRVLIAGTCGVCGGDYETAWHLFLDCNVVRAGWRKLNLEQDIIALQTGNFSMQDCLWTLLKHQDRTVQAKILTGIWSIWRERNNRIWNNKTTPIDMVLQGSNQYLQDWKAAQARLPPNQTITAPPLCPKWHPPPTGYLKCNVDVATFATHHKTGWGMAIRDDLGHILHYRMSLRDGDIPVNDGEAIAMLDAIHWLTDLDLHHVILEGDSLQVKQAIDNEVEDHTEFGDIIRQSRHLMRSSGDYSYNFVRRERNQVAHKLARQSLFHTSPSVGNVPPLWLADVADCICRSAHF